MALGLLEGNFSIRGDEKVVLVVCSSIVEENIILSVPMLSNVLGASDDGGSRIQLSNVSFVKIPMSMSMQRLSFNIHERATDTYEVVAIVPLLRE